jgi:hypothetical protein
MNEQISWKEIIVDIADARNLVDAIRDFVEHERPTPMETVSGWAAEYASFCATANERLRLCRDYLRRGMRAEAVHSAKADPNLLTLVSTLEFRDRRSWNNYCAENGLPIANTLLLDVASELNEAFAAQQPLEELLREHRTLALSRAPMKDRVRVLKRIAKTDSANDIWETDVRDYEKERFREMEGELRQAMQGRDLDGLESLRDELSDGTWMFLDVDEARSSVESCIAKTAAFYSRKSLKELADQLHVAHQSLDVAEGQQLRKEWELHASQASVTDDEPLAQQVKPALQWLATEDARKEAESRYQNILASLEQALDDSSPQDEVDRLYHALSGLDRPVPPGIEARVRHRERQHEVKSKQRSTLVVVGAIGSVLIVAALIAFFVRNSYQQNAIADAKESIDRMVDDGRIGEADAFVASLQKTQPNIAASPTVQASIAHLEQTKADEAQRVERFKVLLEQLTQCPLEEKEPAIVSELRSIAKEPDENKKIQDLLTQRDVARQELQRTQDDRFRSSINELSNLLDKATSHAANDNVAEDARASEMQNAILKTIDELSGQESQVTPEIRSLLAAQKARNEGVLRRLEANRQARDAHQKMLTAFDRQDVVEDFVDAAKQWIAAKPDDPLTKDLKKSLGDRPIYEAVLAWNSVSQSLSNVLEIDSRSAKAQADRIAAYVQAYPNAPMATQASAYSKLLLSIQALPSQIAKLDALFSNPIIKSSHVVTDRSSKNVYLTTDKIPDPIPDAGFSMSYIINNEMNVRSAFIRAGSIIERSPQSVIAERAIPKIDSMSFKTWSTSGVQFLIDIHENNGINPVLRAKLLTDIITILVEGSPSLAGPLEAQKSLLENIAKRHKLDCNWMDPTDEEGAKVTEAVRDELVRLRFSPDIARQTDAVILKAWKSLRVQYRAVGWVSRQTANKTDGRNTTDWRLESPKTLNALNDELVFFHPDRTPGQITESRIEIVDRNQISSKSSAGLSTGIMVFLRSEVNS